ncbi:hypothetical protein [Actinomycetospora aeridis]|uniref:Uncharacterized protein n=1 Tax=Actinomycetospora aeridis TaxID=3129231 RepID=A0ABU8NCQ4_9PSEU
MDEHAASTRDEDAAVREETEQLADGRTIRFFSWAPEGEDA